MGDDGPQGIKVEQEQFVLDVKVTAGLLNRDAGLLNERNVLVVITQRR